MAAVDLNGIVPASTGRGSHGDIEGLLGVVTSVALPCWFDAVDPGVLRTVCRAAATRSVSIGALVSAPESIDLGGGDRDGMALRDAVLYQIGALDGFAQVAGAGVLYIKPNVLLAGACLDDPDLAAAVVEAAHEYDPSIAVVGPPGSHLLAAADAHGTELVPEMLANRAYRADGRPLQRTEPGAVIAEPDVVVARALSIGADRRVRAVDGSILDVRARTIAIDGDGDESIDVLRHARAGLESAGVGIRPFAF